MNNIAFFEIQATEPEKLVHFYREIFGWQFSRQPGMPIEYWRIVTDGMNGGLLKRPAKTPPTESGTNAFVCSIEVENFDKTASKIMQHGGQIALPKFAVPGTCWQGYFVDIDGNTFGIFEVDANAR
jgi:predicted enzyme related to lactoylglutathione lyase